MDNGKLALSSGSTKAQDDIWFYCVFDRLRVYTADYGFNFRSLEQRPTSFFLINRALITSTLKNGIEKYTNDLKVNSVDVGYDPADEQQADSFAYRLFLCGGKQNRGKGCNICIIWLIPKNPSLRIFPDYPLEHSKS